MDAIVIEPSPNPSIIFDRVEIKIPNVHNFISVAKMHVIRHKIQLELNADVVANNRLHRGRHLLILPNLATGTDPQANKAGGQNNDQHKANSLSE